MLKISLITASFNSEKTIANTLDSILIQENKYPLEYIVMDGNSKDGTVEIIKKYESKFKEKNIAFKWISEPDNGIYEAWNKALKLASGDWIGFIGSDDEYVKDAMVNYENVFLKNPELDYVCSIVKYTNNNVDCISFSNGKLMKLSHVGSFHSKNYFTKYGDFNTEFKIVGDYELLLRKKELNYKLIPKPLVIMGIEGVSSKKVFETLVEVRDARSNNYFSALQANILFYKEVVRIYINKIVRFIVGETLTQKFYKYRNAKRLK